MITGTRYVAWFALSIGLVLTIVGGASFFVNVQGMVLNGSPVTSTGQKYEFIFTALALSGFSALAIVLLRPKVLNRIRLIANIASLLEHLPVGSGRYQLYAIIALPLLSVIVVGLLSGITLTDRLLFILGVPIVLGIGFLMTFLVVGFQVINPFCPERVLRFFALTFMTIPFWAAIFSLPSLLLYAGGDPSAALTPSCCTGMAVGAAVVLRRWTKFVPDEYLECA